MLACPGTILSLMQDIGILLNRISFCDIDIRSQNVKTSKRHDLVAQIVPSLIAVTLDYLVQSGLSPLCSWYQRKALAQR